VFLDNVFISSMCSVRCTLMFYTESEPHFSD
ncbi:hypothetical protein X975_26499, partial [Stegodyphus mimosarum]